MTRISRASASCAFALAIATPSAMEISGPCRTSECRSETEQHLERLRNVVEPPAKLDARSAGNLQADADALHPAIARPGPRLETRPHRRVGDPRLRAAEALPQLAVTAACRSAFLNDTEHGAMPRVRYSLLWDPPVRESPISRPRPCAFRRLHHPRAFAHITQNSKSSEKARGPARRTQSTPVPGAPTETRLSNIWRRSVGRSLSARACEGLARITRADARLRRPLLRNRDRPEKGPVCLVLQRQILIVAPP